MATRWCRWSQYSTVAGIPVPDLIKMGRSTQEQIDAIVKRTRGGGGEIVALLKTGSAFTPRRPAASRWPRAYLKDQKRLLPCAAHLTGQYGVDDLYVGVPVVIGAGGVEQIVEIELDDEAKANLQVSVDAVKELLVACKGDRQLEPGLSRYRSPRRAREHRPRSAVRAARCAVDAAAMAGACRPAIDRAESMPRAGRSRRRSVRPAGRGHADATRGATRRDGASSASTAERTHAVMPVSAAGDGDRARSCAIASRRETASAVVRADRQAEVSQSSCDSGQPSRSDCRRAPASQLPRPSTNGRPALRHRP